MTEQSEPEAGNTGCHHGEYKDGDPDDPRGVEPAHHARRPMNAFLIFCKRHRTVVRDKYPNLENRSITKILGEWWANLEDDEKASYTGLAKKYKDAFFSANPDFKWYKLPAPPLRTLSTRPTNIFSTAPTDYRHVKNENMEIEEEKTNNNSTKIDYNKRLFVGHEDAGNSTAFTPGKLADEAQMGGLSSLMFDNRNVSPETQRNTFLDLSKQISLQCTPNYKVVCNDPPGAPRKRSISETDPENSNKYFKEESIQSQTKVTEPDMEQSTDLQNALSETSRMLEKAFESKGDAMNGNRKLEGVGLNKNSDSMNPKTEDQISSNLTQQEIIDRVVNRKLTDFKAEDETPINRNELSRLSWGMDFTKDPKASERSCKGKRYEEFMAFGGLYVNKRQKRDFDSKAYEYYEKNIKTEYSNSPSCSWKNVHSSDRPSGSSASLEYDSDHEENNKDTSNHESEANSKMFKASDFDLDAKIRALPSLSFEKFHQKKKENKKRKSNIAMKAKDFHPRHSEKPHSTFFPTTKGGIFCSENKVYIPQTTSQLPDKQQYGPKPNSNNGSHQKDRSDQLRSAFIGSKKRKPRKISITRLDVNTSIKTDFLNRDQHYGALQTEYTTSCNNTLQPLPLVSEPQIDLCALETLAEVASKTSKINENN